MIEAALLIAAIVQLIPLVGLTGVSGLRRLYGFEIHEPQLVLLLRHRAVLLALVGLILLAAIAVPAWRAPAIAIGLISKLSFLLLIAVSPKPNALIARVAKVDAVTSLLLVVAAVLMQW
jgi:hypothetical protein